MAFFIKAAEFAQPEAVAEVGAALGELEGDGVAVLEGDLVGGELGFVPVSDILTSKESR